MLKILLIEDSDSDAYIIQKAIKQHMPDAVCTRAENVAKGENILKKQETDIILLDLTLPDSPNPAETYARVYQAAGAIPIVISTSIRDHALAKSLVHGGAEDYLNKDRIMDRAEHVKESLEFAMERHANFQKTVAEKDSALKESAEKDAVLNCFMGGYSVSSKK